MRNGRICHVDIIVGINGTGKTTWCLKMFRLLARIRPVYIVHLGTEQAFNVFPKVSILDRKQVSRIKNGIYQISAHDHIKDVAETTDVVGWDKDKQKEVVKRRDVFYFIFKNLHNAFVVFDDVRNLIGDNMTKSVEDLLINRRQKMLDLFFIFHGLNLIPPRLFDYYTLLIVFNTMGKIDRSLHKIPFGDTIEKICDIVNERSNSVKNAYAIIDPKNLNNIKNIKIDYVKP